MTARKRTSPKVRFGEPTSDANWIALMGEYDAFGKKYRDLEDSTLKMYKWYLGSFATWLMEESGLAGLEELDFQALVAFVLVYGDTHDRCQSMYSALRSFLLFAHINGYVSTDLRSAIPRVRERALSKVPFILSDKSVGQVLGAIDRETVVGRRDYAVIQILLNYGIRGIQARNMKLQDIHWRAGRILIQPAKRGKAVEQPLLPEVGNALVDYLQKGRPQNTNHQEIFLTTLSPWKPLSQSTMTLMVARRLKRAKIRLPENVRKGSHLFRHLFASKMLENDVPLNHIAEMLGHRNESSTLIYTKIDYNNLMDIAQEWPAVLS